MSDLWGFIDTPEVQHRLAMAWDEWADKIRHGPVRDLPFKTNHYKYFVDHGEGSDNYPRESFVSYWDQSKRRGFGQKQINIDLLDVHPEFRNRGVAEALIRRIHQDHPDFKIRPGGMTEQGQAFHDKMLEKEPAARDLVTARLGMAWQDYYDKIQHDVEEDHGWGDPPSASYHIPEIDSGLEYHYDPNDKINKIYVDWLYTDPDHRNDGVAEAFFRRMHQDHPNHHIVPGEMTNEGQAFHDRMLQKEPTARDLVMAASRIVEAMAWQDWKDKIKGGCKDGCIQQGNMMHGRYIIPEAGAFLNYSHRAGPQLFISDIYTHPQNRNDGVAEALMRRLAEDHPGVPINPGYMTPDGQKFHDRMLEKEPTARDLVTAANHIVAMAWDEWAPKIRRQTSDGHSDEDFCVNGDCSSFDWRHEGRGMRYEIEHDDGAWSALDYGHYADSQNNPYVAVHMIRTHPDYRKDGIAEAFMRRLVDDHPGIRIDPGDMSIDGKAFHDRMLEKEPTARDLVM